MKRNRPTVITDAPEHRSIPLDRVELRADASGQVTLEGYASTFEPYEMYGGPAAGGWIEQIDKKAFAKTLRESPDLMLLINHEGMPLARTKSGTLKLSVDSHGLKVSAKLDRSDPDVQRLEAKMRRGDMDEMSFAFRVKAQKWEATDDFPEDLYALRTILEVSLHKGDVSVVNYGANPTTHAEVKARQKGTTMGRRPMSLREAEAIAAGTSGGTGRPMSVRQAEALARSGGSPRSRTAIQRQEQAEDRQRRALKAAGDEVVARAQRLLDSYRPPSAQRNRAAAVSAVVPSLRAANDSTVGMAMPAIGPMLHDSRARMQAERARALRDAQAWPFIGTKLSSELK
ncbi:Phage head maturation protease [Mycolicibacterium fortuitum]|uniref:Phage head maturation protease n=1 Tax=Mycolicibacterium fortuitum TaxID=1766 RepID=A0A0N9Y5V6_MYCFO|nr:HK97 family phage prohead protease [Mycolicibacterium fortuitum]ALI26568.1 Phage head maturation protease [Mycolicibacterium fortuitum]